MVPRDALDFYCVEDEEAAMEQGVSLGSPIRHICVNEAGDRVMMHDAFGFYYFENEKAAMD